MSDEKGVRDVNLGDFCGDGADFFLQQTITRSEKAFEVEIPGLLLRCEGAFLGGYKDAAVLVNDRGAGRRAAWLSSEVADTESLLQAYYEVGGEIGVHALTRFAVRLESTAGRKAYRLAPAEA